MAVIYNYIHSTRTFAYNKMFHVHCFIADLQSISFNPDKIVNTHLNCASRIHELNKNSFLDAMSYFPNIPSAKHTIRLTEGNFALNKILYIFITCTNNEKFLTLPLSSP